MEQLSITHAIRRGWNIFADRPGIFIGATFLVLVLSWILTGVSGQHSGAHPVPQSPLMTLVGFIALLLMFLLDLGFTAFFLKAHGDVKSVQIVDLWHPQKYFHYLLVMVAASILFVVGFMLFFVPGIIAVTILFFIKYVTLEKDLSFVETFRESARITKGHRLTLLGLALALIALNILGALCLGVGLLVSIPVSSLAVVEAYRTLMPASTQTEALAETTVQA